MEAQSSIKKILFYNKIMANKNTKRARAKGFCSMDDMNNNGNTIYKGDCCDTAWDNKNSNHRSRKNYSKRPASDYTE